jgi:hypothetical protein
MSDFKSKLIEERNSLLKKTNKLDSFIDSDRFNIVGKIQGKLLLNQYDAMCDYLNCLNLRIQDLDKN